MRANLFNSLKAAEFKLSLVQRKDIKNNEEKVSEHLQTINDATGRSDWTWEVNWENFVGLAKSSNSSPDSPGSTAASILENLAAAIKKLCSDDMSQEAFNEAATTGKILVACDAKYKDFSYHKCAFENGDLVVKMKYFCNFYDIGSDLEKLL